MRIIVAAAAIVFVLSRIGHCDADTEWRKQLAANAFSERLTRFNERFSSLRYRADDRMRALSELQDVTGVRFLPPASDANGTYFGIEWEGRRLADVGIPGGQYNPAHPEVRAELRRQIDKAKTDSIELKLGDGGPEDTERVREAMSANGVSINWERAELALPTGTISIKHSPSLSFSVTPNGELSVRGSGRIEHFEKRFKAGELTHSESAPRWARESPRRPADRADENGH